MGESQDWGAQGSTGPYLAFLRPLPGLPQLSAFLNLHWDLPLAKPIGKPESRGAFLYPRKFSLGQRAEWKRQNRDPGEQEENIQPKKQGLGKTYFDVQPCTISPRWIGTHTGFLVPWPKIYSMAPALKFTPL